MPWYCLYDVPSGRINQFMNIPDGDAGLYEGLGLEILACETAPSFLKDYVLAGNVTPRPVLPNFDKTSILADGVDCATLSGLPDPCEVRINGQSFPVTGGVLELDADYPGTYRVEIRHFPYRDFVQEILAT